LFFHCVDCGLVRKRRKRKKKSAGAKGVITAPRLTA